MGELHKGGSSFVGYEYKEISADSEKASMLLDGYLCFGWIPDENIQPSRILGRISVKLKRDRKILNKAELTRLQRHFEACINDIEELEKSKTEAASVCSISTGFIGTALIAGSVFAVTAETPLIMLCIILGIPGLIGCALAPVVFRKIVQRRMLRTAPLIDQKYDEIYEIIEKGSKLLL